jgi:hypothetical protein
MAGEAHDTDIPILRKRTKRSAHQFLNMLMTATTTSYLIFRHLL